MGHIQDFVFHFFWFNTLAVVFIRKQYFRPGGMAALEWTHSHRAIRDFPGADDFASGVNLPIAFHIAL